MSLGQTPNPNVRAWVSERVRVCFYTARRSSVLSMGSGLSACTPLTSPPSKHIGKTTRMVQWRRKSAKRWEPVTVHRLPSQWLIYPCMLHRACLMFWSLQCSLVLFVCCSGAGGGSRCSGRRRGRGSRQPAAVENETQTGQFCSGPAH